MSEEILSTYEIELFLEHYEIIKLEEIGKKRWFSKNATMVKLFQVAALEASVGGRERVKESASSFSKVEYFIKDLITLSVWKENVLPELLKIRPEPDHALPTYIILYNEIALVGLLQSLLFHSELFRDIDDSCTDLIDYCVNKLTKLNPEDIPLINELKVETTALQDIIKHNKNINFMIGAQCTSLLRYICENLKTLPANVAARIYTTHDLPLLITQLIDMEIWCKRTEDGQLYKFHDDRWKQWFPKDPPLSKLEIQTWLLIHQLLLNPPSNSTYHYSQYRMEQFSRLIRHLNETVIDQVSPLSDLKHWLHMATVSGDGESGPRVHNSLIVDITKQYRDLVYEEYEGKWKEIALARSSLLFYPDKSEIQYLSMGFSNCMDHVEKMVDNLQTCLNCHAKAFQRCSKCKTAWYCTRKCQVENWPAHKHLCKA